ncbi:hypothetical protein LQW54_008414 [Pestalotiopsis sp. IQ-011]
MHASILTIMTAVASAAAISPSQDTGILAEITGWKELSSCLSSSGPAAAPSFYVQNTTMGCIPLPYAVESLQLAALRDGPYLVGYFTDGACADLARGTTVSEPGDCMHSAIGPWASINISTYE